MTAQGHIDLERPDALTLRGIAGLMHLLPLMATFFVATLGLQLALASDTAVSAALSQVIASLGSFTLEQIITGVVYVAMGFLVIALVLFPVELAAVGIMPAVLVAYSHPAGNAVLMFFAAMAMAWAVIRWGVKGVASKRHHRALNDNFNFSETV